MRFCERGCVSSTIHITGSKDLGRSETLSASKVTLVLIVIAQIFEDLQRTDIPEAYVPPDDAKLDRFLMTMHHLKWYPAELEREPIFDIDAMQGRDWVWYFLEKVQALKAVKICWPYDNFGSDIWIITVDGTHCWITEPVHPEWSQDSRYFSHKYGKAGVVYELGFALASSRLVWMNGPIPAGDLDLSVFKKKGLKDKLAVAEKRGIADSRKEVKRFKSRALKRHKTFNGMTKTFECLSGASAMVLTGLRHASKLSVL